MKDSDNYYASLVGRDVRILRSPSDEELLEWSKGMATRENWTVGKDHLPGGALVSTVFLGINHQYGKGAPLWFETMVFGGPNDGYQERYSTYDEAEAGHQRTVNAVKAGRTL